MALPRQAAKRWTSLVAAAAATLFTSVVAILTGLQPLPRTVPIVMLVQNYPVQVLFAGGTLLLLTIAAWFIARQPEQGSPPGQRVARGRRSGSVPFRLVVVFAALAATLATSFSVLTVAVVLIRPSWCPAALCLQPLAPHDAYLAADFNSFESSTYLVRGDPLTFSVRDLPDNANRTSVAVQRVLSSVQDIASGPAYRLALNVTSLSRIDTGTIIDGIRLSVVNARPPPSPLRVVLVGAPLDYHANPYLAIYTGQSSGDSITASYVGPVRLGYVQLRPGESDELSIQVASRGIVDLQFRVEIFYRNISESMVRSFELPYLFEIAFSDQLDWVQFEFRNGHLVPD